MADGAEVPSHLFEAFPHHPPPLSRSYQLRRSKGQDGEEQDERKGKDKEERSRRGYNNDHPGADKGHYRKRPEDDDDDDLGG